MGYSKLIGLKKTAKNLLVTYGLPALIYLADNIRDFVPDKYLLPVGAIIAGVCYFAKNYYENK